jgi:hypothetical protein
MPFEVTRVAAHDALRPVVTRHGEKRLVRHLVKLLERLDVLGLSCDADLQRQDAVQSRQSFTGRVFGKLAHHFGFQCNAHELRLADSVGVYGRDQRAWLRIDPHKSFLGQLLQGVAQGCQAGIDARPVGPPSNRAVPVSSPRKPTEIALRSSGLGLSESFIASGLHSC